MGNNNKDYLEYYIVSPESKPFFKTPIDRQKVYQEVFNTELGSKVLKDLLHSTGFFRQSFNKDSTAQMAFNEGKKETCRHIINILTTTITTKG